MTQFDNIRGLREIGESLKQFPEEFKTKAVRGAVRAGGRVFLDAVKSGVSVRSGLLRDGLRLRTKIDGEAARASVVATGKHAFVANWVEHGTAAHKIIAKHAKALFFGGVFRESIDHPGAAPKPFFRPALDTRSRDALQAVGDSLRRWLRRKGIKDVARMEVGE